MGCVPVRVQPQPGPMSYQAAATRRSSTTAPSTAIAKDLLFIIPNLTPGGISACPVPVQPAAASRRLVQQPPSARRSASSELRNDSAATHRWPRR
jgi:hypothetical protein